MKKVPSKPTRFTDKQTRLAGLIKALGHPARVAIVEHLLKVSECICGDIVDALPLAQPTISQHLKELKNAGLIKGSVAGNAVCYCLEEQGFRKLAAYFSAAADQIKNQNNCC